MCKQGGKTIPAVAVINKSGLLFLLDRVTGKPIYGVEERPVPQSEVPLERSSKTQPFPLKPPPLSRMTMTLEDIATVTPELEAACRKLMEGHAARRPVPAARLQAAARAVPRQPWRRQLGRHRRSIRSWAICSSTRTRSVRWRDSRDRNPNDKGSA